MKNEDSLVKGSARLSNGGESWAWARTRARWLTWKGSVKNLSDSLDQRLL